MIKTIDIQPHEARRIYDILVEECGASEKDRQWFVNLQTEDHVREYRFQGDLGYGGKFWRNNGKWYVNFYAEDETSCRVEMTWKANKKLATLRHEIVNIRI